MILKNKKEIEEIEKARKKNEKIKKTSYKNLYMTLDDLRFATNEKVAKYRAKRLKCDTLVEVGSGIGLQSIEFARTCKKVYAIEIDKRKISYARENAKLLKIKNIEFIEGNALKVHDRIKKADIVFCETERSAEAKERNLSELRPDINKLIKAYSRLTDKFCAEVPPQLKSIDMDCEKEYVSVNHDLNRLNLYFGSLKKAEKSAVALPGLHRLEENKGKARKSQALKYIYEADKAVAKAGLMDELAIKENLYLFADGLLTSNKKTKSPFFKNSFLVLGTCKSFDETTDILKRGDFGRVILRQKIRPELYWKERNRYEKRLKGKKTAYLFVFKSSSLVCKKI